MIINDAYIHFETNMICINKLHFRFHLTRENNINVTDDTSKDQWTHAYNFVQLPGCIITPNFLNITLIYKRKHISYTHFMHGVYDKSI